MFTTSSKIARLSTPMTTLHNLCFRAPNEIFARHLLRNARELKLPIRHSLFEVFMASTDGISKVVGECTVEMTIGRKAYPHVYLGVLKYWCADAEISPESRH